MKLLCIAVGKKHDPAIAAAIGDYTQRLNRYVAFEWRILAPAKGQTQADVSRRLESASVLAQVQGDDYLILLDEHGLQLTSPALADMLSTIEQQTAGNKRIVLVIGGAHGVSQQLQQRAHQTWSLSPLTFPHQLVRLLLVEQLYRTQTIRRGEPYHHQ